MSIYVTTPVGSTYPTHPRR